MTYQAIILEKKENVAVVTLNRPERLNALNSQLTQELLSALDDVDEDDEMRVLVLTGVGRGFCSGGDVGGMTEGMASGTGTARGTGGMREGPPRGVGGIVQRIRKIQKPTIAMVNGAAVGAGFDLAMSVSALEIKRGRGFSPRPHLSRY